MHIINQYLLREIFKYFAVILTMVIGIYLAVDFFEKIDDFMEAGLPFSKVFSFFVFKTPFIVAQITPVGILLSVLVAFGLMNKNNEIIALKSSGVSVYYLLRPVLLMGGFFSVLLFSLSEIIVPITVNKANHIWLREVRHETAVASDEKNIWIKGKRFIAHIKYYHSKKQMIYGVTLNYFDNQFKLIRRVDAQRGFYDQGKWHLYDIMEQRFSRAGGKDQVAIIEKRLEPLDFKPADLQRVVKKSEEMNFKELFGYIRKIEEEGYDATILRVDLYAKFAFPFVCFILCIAGVGTALRIRVKESLPISIVSGIGIAFLYWIFYSFCVSLGYGEMLPPIVAVSAANFVFLCFGILILLNAD
jgi:lipopolysaccharide export system permease protein